MHQNEKNEKLLIWKLIFFIHILDEKAIEMVFFHWWHLISFKNRYCYVLLQF